MNAMTRAQRITHPVLGGRRRAELGLSLAIDLIAED